ncbi:MAG: hypothetical protein SF339_26850 [Blastocatellia bacterium]|nr:hypothetical protein [Blastocatellia bacterium]
MMQTRKFHRVIGLLLLLPMLGWVVTGFVFFTKPGYDGAYEMLQPKTYPLGEDPISVTPAPAWLEFRRVRTILGPHLLVRTAQGWQQLDPATLAPRPLPAEDEVRRLLTDAIANRAARYGRLASLANGTAVTSTKIQLTLDWNRLSLQQKGPDTDRIDQLYKIHYLQWTGVKWLDRILGMAGLALLALLSLLGLALQFGLRRPASQK